MITMTKGDLVKNLTNQGNADKLKLDGWVIDGEELKVDRDALKAQAKELGLEFAGNIKTPKLLELIEEAKAE